MKCPHIDVVMDPRDLILSLEIPQIFKTFNSFSLGLFPTKDFFKSDIIAPVSTRRTTGASEMSMYTFIRGLSGLRCNLTSLTDTVSGSPLEEFLFKHFDTSKHSGDPECFFDVTEDKAGLGGPS